MVPKGGGDTMGKIVIPIVDAMENDMGEEKGNLLLGTVLRRSQTNWRREKWRGGVKINGRVSSRIFTFLSTVCQLRSMDFSCFSGGITEQKMPRS